MNVTFARLARPVMIPGATKTDDVYSIKTHSGIVMEFKEGHLWLTIRGVTAILSMANVLVLVTEAE